MSSKIAIFLVIFSVCQIIDSAPQFDDPDLFDGLRGLFSPVRNIANGFSSRMLGFDIIPNKARRGGWNANNQFPNVNFNSRALPAQGQAQLGSIDAQFPSATFVIKPQEQTAAATV